MTAGAHLPEEFFEMTSELLNRLPEVADRLPDCYVEIDFSDASKWVQPACEAPGWNANVDLVKDPEARTVETEMLTVYAPDEALLARALFDQRLFPEAAKIAEKCDVEAVYRVLDVMWGKTKSGVRYECSIEASHVISFYREADKRRQKAEAKKEAAEILQGAQRVWDESMRSLAEAYRSPGMMEIVERKVTSKPLPPDSQTKIVSNGVTCHRAGEHAWSL